MLHTLQFENISKAFAGVQALRDVSFTARSGEVCALVGENGAGKSTLLKVLSGVLHADSGSCYLDGEELRFRDPVDAINRGISIISQERQLVPNLTVMENIFMEGLPTRVLGFVDFRKMERETQEIIDAFKLPIKPRQKVCDLSVAHQQMVEIMKAYRRNSLVIAFDEPTAPLSEGEITALFQVISDLKKAGKIILYVSHRLQELFVIAEHIVVMKDGELVIQVTPQSTDVQQLVSYMVGRDLGDVFDELDRNDQIGEVVLEARGLTNSYIKDISFELHRGEILGFSGLVGSGRTETARAIFSADPITAGEIFIEGRQASIQDPSDAIRLGIGLCPEDRKEQGLILLASVKHNISLPNLEQITKHGFIDTNAERMMVEREVERLKIKTPTIEKQTIELSGGNQQKVILGRWLAAGLKVLILDEPTKGIDAGAKAEIYQIVCDLAKMGLGILFISSELTEVINVCDNIIVMREGEITGKLTRSEATEERVLRLAMVEDNSSKGVKLE